jgi:hypothetical protein
VRKSGWVVDIADGVEVVSSGGLACCGSRELEGVGVGKYLKPKFGGVRETLGLVFEGNRVW